MAEGSATGKSFKREIRSLQEAAQLALKRGDCYHARRLNLDIIRLTAGHNAPDISEIARAATHQIQNLAPDPWALGWGAASGLVYLAAWWLALG